MRRYTLALLLSIAALLAACGTATHLHRHGDHGRDGKRQNVRVEEDLSALPVGTVVHVCLRHAPCVTERTSAGSRSDEHTIDVPLPAGVSARDADGWPLRAYAVVDGQRLVANTRIAYHVSIDPPCKCSGDYAYVRLAYKAYAANSA